ncbi:hypothetical protein CDL12_17602 [Handroanthus impetiginosus]|uniref:Transcription repressor n=1 Tax=Handroanthus impetiginosus TaxID=429701 RepID=A0A2G9GWZ6_9LAMI|nr:hypothetical protein CDL12_17602 [Handroanthus impetiginosus]
MAETCLKIRLRRMLGSCKSKDLLSDVVETHHHRQHYQLIELFSPPQMAEESCKLPLLSSHINGRKYPPASPIISPLNNFYDVVPKEKKKKRTKRLNSIASKKYSVFEEEDERAALFSGGRYSTSTRRSMSAVEDSLAVVKRSRDPYNDFRRSMVEMIVEKELYAAKDLENLLLCFLSLNSHNHHKVIVEVFAEIWEALLM